MSKPGISLIKHGFFDKSFKSKECFSFKADDFDLDQLHNECSSLYQLFISNRLYWVKESDLIAYLFYLCNLLISYYQYDYVRADLQLLTSRREEIERFIKQHFSLKEQEAITKPSKELLTTGKRNTSSFVSIAKIRKHLSILNANRSHWVYSRGLANHAIIYLQNHCDPTLIYYCNQFPGNPCVSGDIIDLLNRSRVPLAILGIILYGLRFLINLVLMLKHIISATKSKELSPRKVLIHELDKRGYTMANDCVWATVGLLTTYNLFFQIATAAVSPIIMAFLAFDSLLLTVQWCVEMVKYNKRLEELIEQEKGATVLEQVVIKRQIDLLNDEWAVQSAHYIINILAANLIVISFGISMLCSGPLILAGLALFSMLGNAIYNTAEEFKQYQKASIAVQRELANGEILNDAHHQNLIQVLNEECSQANAVFWQTLAFNVGGTAFIIIAAVISWPVALSLTLAYVAYRLISAYQNQSGEPEKVYASSNEIYRPLHTDQFAVNALGCI